MGHMTFGGVNAHKRLPLLPPIQISSPFSSIDNALAVLLDGLTLHEDEVSPVASS